MLVCSCDKYWCVSVTNILPCVSIECVCLGDCGLPLALFQVEFSPHHVNQGGVEKTTPKVTLYKSHTAKESLAGTTRYWLVVWTKRGNSELLLVLLPPHERVCVVGHLKGWWRRGDIKVTKQKQLSNPGQKSPTDAPREAQDIIKSVLTVSRQNYGKDSYIIDLEGPERSYWLGTESGLLGPFTSTGHERLEMSPVM